MSCTQAGILYSLTQLPLGLLSEAVKFQPDPQTVITSVGLLLAEPTGLEKALSIIVFN